jgi:hypothetical protein
LVDLPSGYRRVAPSRLNLPPTMRIERTQKPNHGWAGARSCALHRRLRAAKRAIPAR